jgi:protocatechuate 3,4-dioxygenase beta subunit
MRFTTTTIATLASLLVVSAHPGEDHHHEAVERRAALGSMTRRSLSHCADKLAARGIHARNEARRRALLDTHARRKRDLASVVATDHHSDLTGVTEDTESSTFFTGENQCILAPEVTQGPYCELMALSVKLTLSDVTGELFRKDVTEDQAGVPLILDVQIIDTTTCEPLSGVALDFWHCNATGVYSGVVASGNGDSSDETNINNTFLRGIQESDSDGVVQFHSIVPGHYSGRTTHAHILAHTAGNWELLDNNTISGGETSAHVGQLFFDQDLLTQVETVSPYSTNTQQITQNADDSIMGEEAADIDPVVEYVLLGDSIADGIFAWISMGIDSSASSTVEPAVRYGASGGVVNADASMGMGGGPGGNSGGPGGNGTMGGTAPSGNGTDLAMNGTAPSGAASASVVASPVSASASKSASVSASKSASAASGSASAATSGTSGAQGLTGELLQCSLPLVIIY